MKKNKEQRNLLTGLAFIAPNFLGFALFLLIPVLFSMVMSFSNWNLMKSVSFQWIGLRNYIELFHDREFWLYLINTAYLMLGIPVSIALSLLLAILLTKPLRGIVVYRTLFYLPTFTAGVALFVLWKSLYNPDYGPINAVIGWILDRAGAGSVALPGWLSSVQNLFGLHPEKIQGLVPEFFGLGARDAIIIMGIWVAAGGTNMLLYIAAISNIPTDLYEAAEIDGAGGWAQFRHITWPQLAPTTFFIVIMSFIGGLQGGFEQARVLTEGGPAGTTTTLSYYIYIKAFEEFQMGYASAIAWVLFAMIFAVTMVNWSFGSRRINE